MLETISPSIFAFHVVPFIESSKDLLALRVTSKALKSLLHDSDSSEQIWKCFLSRDFHFTIDDSITSTNQHYLKSLKVSSQKPIDYDPTNGAMREDDRRRPASIFGYQASNGVYTAETAYQSWRQWQIAKQRYCDGCPRDKIQYVKMNAPYFLRAASLWTKIERWCNQEKNREFGATIMNSLHNGQSFKNGRFAEYYPNQPLHSNDPYFKETPAYAELHGQGTDAFRAIFAFYDGQFTNNEALDLGRSHRHIQHSQNWYDEFYDWHDEYFFGGLFGGYVVYQFLSCLRLNSTSFSGTGSTRFKCVAMNSFNDNAHVRPCFVYVDCSDGNMFTSDFEPREVVNLFRAQPVSIMKRNDTFDAGLLWMEEFSQKLDNDELETESIPLDGGEYSTKMLLVYPTENCRDFHNNIPRVSRAVTRGIEIVASSHYDPFLGENVSYSIRMRLLTSTEEGYLSPSERGFETCQLMSRHWVLTKRVTNEDETVDGDGVVGFYPILMEGGHRADGGFDVDSIERGIITDELFRYQSLSPIDCVSFKGRVRFMPGTLAEPKGRPFYADVGQFALVGPEQF